MPRQAVSLVDGVGRTNIDWAGIADPHALETVDFAILPGEFGVAENGAIWVTDRSVRHRAMYFHRATSGAGDFGGEHRAQYASGL